MGSPGEKTIPFFQFLSTVCAKEAISNPAATNYTDISEISNEYAYKKSIFLKFKNQAGMPKAVTNNI